MEERKRISRAASSQLISPPQTTRPVLRGGSSTASLHWTSRTGFNQSIPSRDDIQRWQTTFLNGRNCSSEFSPEPAPVPKTENKSYGLPKIGLHRVKSGENLGPRWFREEEPAQLAPDVQYRRKKPKDREDTYRTLFPTSSVDFYQLPKTTSKPWTNIDLKVDSDLANFGVNASNAFRSYWLKHHSLRYRKFFINEHPEFELGDTSHHRLKDHIVDYREAMLSVKHMMMGAWNTKK